MEKKADHLNCEECTTSNCSVSSQFLSTDARISLVTVEYLEGNHMNDNILP